MFERWVLANCKFAQTTKITKEFEITAPAETMERFEAFLAMLHYNGGHSGYFGLNFDGDGSDSLHVDPKPPKYEAGSKISGTGANVEIAMSSESAVGYFFDLDRGKWMSDGDDCWKEKREEGGWEWKKVDTGGKDYESTASWIRRNCKFAGRPYNNEYEDQDQWREEQMSAYDDRMNFSDKIGEYNVDDGKRFKILPDHDTESGEPNWVLIEREGNEWGILEETWSLDEIFRVIDTKLREDATPDRIPNQAPAPAPAQAPQAPLANQYQPGDILVALYDVTGVGFSPNAQQQENEEVNIPRGERVKVIRRLTGLDALEVEFQGQTVEIGKHLGRATGGVAAFRKAPPTPAIWSENDSAGALEELSK